MKDEKKPSVKERLSDALGVVRKNAPAYAKKAQGYAQKAQKWAGKTTKGRGLDPFGDAFGGGSPRESRRPSRQPQGQGVVYVPVYGRTLARPKKKRQPRERDPLSLDLNLPDFNI